MKILHGYGTSFAQAWRIKPEGTTYVFAGNIKLHCYQQWQQKPEVEYTTYSDKTESTHPLSKLYNGLSEMEVFEKLREMEVAEYNADYSGISDVEIYQSIYYRYSETFGENSGDGNALMIAQGAYGGIWARFRHELANQFGTEADFKAVNRQWLQVTWVWMKSKILALPHSRGTERYTLLEYYVY